MVVLMGTFGFGRTSRQSHSVPYGKIKSRTGSINQCSSYRLSHPVHSEVSTARSSLKSFLAREAALGRDDLVFPILYISVSALEDETLWRQDPVLKVVGTRQYLDWRDFRHRELSDPEVRAEVIQFCRNIMESIEQTVGRQGGATSRGSEQRRGRTSPQGSGNRV